jgi:hypothetical protein
VRISQESVEVLGGSDASVLLSQQVVEVLYLAGGAKVVMAQLF